jgi:16S rRNA (guanine966-N2)-methyltransferase
MPRIVAGAARGRRLAAPPGQGTRPTADRAREALFSAVEARVGSLAGRRVADLYAGTGAVGLEALSRGAAAVLLVESDPAVLRTLRANVETVGLPGAEVRPGRVERLVSGAAGSTAYDVVFLDPPYDVADADLRGVLRDLLRHGWVGPGALAVVERATRGGAWTWPEGYDELRSRRYGEATLWYGRAALSDSPGE